MGKRRLWTADVAEGVARIPLTKGQVAVIDESDLPLVADYPWQAHRTRSKWYARADRTYMHRLLMSYPVGVDHIDGDGLNNRRSNLREATQSGNSANRGPHPGTTSQYKGVSKFKPTGRWAVSITANGKRYHIGYFTDEIEAARAYDRAAVLHQGSFAWLNFPDEQPSR